LGKRAGAIRVQKWNLLNGLSIDLAMQTHIGGKGDSFQRALAVSR